MKRIDTRLDGIQMNSHLTTLRFHSCLLMFLRLSAVAVLVSCVNADTNEGSNSSIGNIVKPGDYQSTIGGWDDQQYPVAFALISSITEWDSLFFPTAAMDYDLPFSPEPEEFANARLLVVARVIFPSGLYNAFSSQIYFLENDILRIEYRYSAPTLGSTFMINNYFGIWVPRTGYSRVEVLENDSLVGQLDIDLGEWALPARL